MLGTLALTLTVGLAPTHTFVAGPNGWLMDGKSYIVRSGSMHYSRVPRAYWIDRLERLKAMGLDTVCTYVFWNYHEPEPGKYVFSGNHDVAKYAGRSARRFERDHSPRPLRLFRVGVGRISLLVGEHPGDTIAAEQPAVPRRARAGSLGSARSWPR